MSQRFQNSYFELILDPVQACWHLESSHKGSPGISGARLQIEYRYGRQHFHSLSTWDPLEIEATEIYHRSIGDAQQIRLPVGPDQHGLQTTVTFYLPEASPLFLWQVSLENLGAKALHLERITLLEAGTIANPACTIERLFAANRSEAEPAFFSNGWQSWSYSGVFGEKDRYKRTRLGIATRQVWFNAGTPVPHSPGHLVSDMFGVLGDRATRQGLLAGFLSQKQHFGSLESRLTAAEPQLCLWANGDGARLDPGERVTTDLVCLQWIDLDAWDPLGTYLETAASENELDPNRPHTTPPVGWCSWYQFQQKITPEIIRQNLQAAHHLQSRLPFDLIQIDDGFQAKIGDWLRFSASFSEGVQPLAAEIKQIDSDPPLKPGLWLAPFIVQPAAHLNQIHPDWLLRGRGNLPVNAGFIWNTFMHALDLTHPAVLEYTSEVIRTAVAEWGFPFLKLDFLYAGALPGRHQDGTRTRAQILRRGLETIREAAGAGTHLLGCGCPLGSAIGLVDSFRIGADVDSHWLPMYYNISFPFRDETNMPSIRNAVHNALTRLPLHRRWWINDPDCLLLRSTTSLSIEEVRTLATINAITQGSLLISDHLPALSKERLQIAEVLVPALDQSARVIDWMDSATPSRVRIDFSNSSGEWNLLALFNWADDPRRIDLTLKDFDLELDEDYFLRSFWDGALVRITSGSHTFEAVPAHAPLLLGVRRRLPGVPQYLGSDLHISQGLEVVNWETAQRAVCFRLHRPGLAQGKIYLHLPNPPADAFCDSGPLSWENPFPQVYQFAVKFNRTALLQIHW